MGKLVSDAAANGKFSLMPIIKHISPRNCNSQPTENIIYKIKSIHSNHHLSLLASEKLHGKHLTPHLEITK
jgi:hypothetical protein